MNYFSFLNYYYEGLFFCSQFITIIRFFCFRNNYCEACFIAYFHVYWLTQTYFFTPFWRYLSTFLSSVFSGSGTIFYIIFSPAILICRVRKNIGAVINDNGNVTGRPTRKYPLAYYSQPLNIISGKNITDAMYPNIAQDYFSSESKD